MHSPSLGFIKTLNFSRAAKNRLAIVLVIISLVSGVATYMALTRSASASTIIWLLNVDLVILLALVVLIVRRVVSLWSGRKRGLAGSRLHVRLVYTFSILAAAPAIIMTLFSAFFFHFGVQTWFSERVQTAVNESQAVAEAYLEEHKQVIRADILAMANDIGRQAFYLRDNESAFDKVVQTQALFRNFSEALVFDSSGEVLARSSLTFLLEFEQVPDYVFERAEEGEVVIMTGGSKEDRVRALLKLGNFTDAYLLVGRMVDPKVLAHLDDTRRAVEDYADLQAKYAGLQISFTMIFLLVGFLLLVVAIWFGLILARQLVTPIGELINAADRVRAGDYTARAPELDMLEEFDDLARSFNRMTGQIEEQQNELLQANRQLDHRRRFTETVLAGVTSGVIGIDHDEKITIANTAALDLLDKEESDLLSYKIQDVVPEISELMALAHSRPHRITEGEIFFREKGEGQRTFLARVAFELIGEEDVGAIVTFDDITALQSAQKKAAWADVARRIAHEIKNPLTPIQLSAERLQRKYKGQIEKEQNIFVECIETITKNVEDIGRMVNEFSAFARMPEPVMKREKLGQLLREALMLHRQAHPQIEFSLRGLDKGEDFELSFDGRQIRQALNNLVQNAVDSIIQSPVDHEDGKVDILITPYDEDHVAVVVSDNGPGLPKDENPLHLSEPYVTHKPKGTGLGLAIVKKVMEDHGGALILDRPSSLKALEGWEDLGGAVIALVLPREEEDQ